MDGEKRDFEGKNQNRFDKKTREKSNQKGPITTTIKTARSARTEPPLIRLVFHTSAPIPASPKIRTDHHSVHCTFNDEFDRRICCLYHIDFHTAKPDGAPFREII